MSVQQFLHTLAQYRVDISPLPQVSTGPDRIQVILTVIFTLLGALSVMFITIGGFRYVASQGDPQAAARAKNTIFYAIIGLIVAICSVAIVTFVLGKL